MEDDLFAPLKEAEVVETEETGELTSKSKKKKKEEADTIPQVDINAIKALDAQLSKEFGDSYYSFTGGRKVEPVQFISWGSYTVDRICGGGLPVGRLVQISGLESSG